MGGKGSGVHLHHHSDGWSYLFEGQKRWFVRPPYTLPRITHMGFMRMRYWLNEGVYPKLQKDSLLEYVSILTKGANAIQQNIGNYKI